MSISLLALGILAWLAVGWLPSRILKHYGTSCFGGVHGRLWLALRVICALAGPLAWPAVLYERWQIWRVDRVPWGWMW